MNNRKNDIIAKIDKKKTITIIQLKTDLEHKLTRMKSVLKEIIIQKMNN